MILSSLCYVKNNFRSFWRNGALRNSTEKGNLLSSQTEHGLSFSIKQMLCELPSDVGKKRQFQLIAVPFQVEAAICDNQRVGRGSNQARGPTTVTGGDRERAETCPKGSSTPDQREATTVVEPPSSKKQKC